MKEGNLIGTPDGSPVKVLTFYHDVVWVAAATLETSFGHWIASMRLAVPVLYHWQKSCDTLLLNSQRFHHVSVLYPISSVSYSQ